jgi:excisionase family DNA binding protein
MAGIAERESEEMVDVRGAARLVGRHPETVRRWVWSGRLHARREGNRLLLRRADVEALAASQGTRPLTLAQWGARARAVRASGRGKGLGGSAADLVLEDRRARSQ